MELYILDSLYRRSEVVEKHESILWAERFNAVGDFELHIPSTLQNRIRFIPGINLAIDVSKRVMTIETVQDVTDEEGRRLLKISGPSIENVLKQRIIARLVLGDWIPWSLEDDPKAIAEAMFHDICVLGLINAGDIIPSVSETNIYPPDTIGAPTDEVVYTPDIQDLYTALKDLCDIFAMGFRLVRNLDTSILYFNIYMGSDRTTAQTTLPAVVFSSNFENLRNTNRLTSSSLYKNVAYVYNETDHEIVYLDDVDPAINGFERRTLLVKVDEGISSPEMIQRGKDELSKNKMFAALDGELASSTSYRYEIDYFLGDFVELRDEDGTTSQMQVTEQIFVHDREGERSYPTLSINTFITPGSWIAWDYAQEWADLGATEYWEDQP